MEGKGAVKRYSSSAFSICRPLVSFLTRGAMEPAQIQGKNRNHQFLPTANEEKVLRAGFVRDEDERPKVPYNHFSKGIPVISLAAIHGPHRDRVRSQVKAACQGWGIFQVVNHGVSEDVIHTISQLSKEFFGLPPEEKLKYGMRGGKRGGFLVSSHLQDESVLNWCEIFVYVLHPLARRGYSLWPEKPVGWRDVVEKYSAELMDLASKLLEIISESLGLESKAVKEACLEMDQKVAINFYQKCPSGNHHAASARPSRRLRTMASTRLPWSLCRELLSSIWVIICSF